MSVLLIIKKKKKNKYVLKDSTGSASFCFVFLSLRHEKVGIFSANTEDARDTGKQFTADFCCF